MEIKAALKLNRNQAGLFFSAITLIALSSLACRLVSSIPEKTAPAPTSILTPPLPSITRVHRPTPTSPPQITSNISNQSIAQTSSCSNLIFRIIPPIEFEKNLFEHHARGTFLILHLEAINQTNQMVQIFREDYHLNYSLNAQLLDVTPQAEATNYLYIRRGESFYQDKITAQSIWHSYIAFDVQPELENWHLIISPGSKYQWNDCEYVVSLSDN